MNVQNLVIIVVLALILIPAIKGMITHMKGEGSCCGGPKEKVPKKKLPGKPQKTLIVHIDGMHCENCKNRVEKHLNEIEPVIAKVNLAKKQAVVSLYGDVEEEKIKETVQALDFLVTGIEEKR
ncbi:MAG: heavy-metal-associated domain-containing protein [Lachnospiraceae bacterium]|nr:heavy-metal-associated domain-containing protein [Lachnospiraceae bacterium]